MIEEESGGGGGGLMKWKERLVEVRKSREPRARASVQRVESLSGFHTDRPTSPRHRIFYSTRYCGLSGTHFV